MTWLPSSKFSRTARRVLYLTAGQLAAYQWRNAQLTDAFLFQATEQGHTEFERYLEEVPSTPTRFLVDLVEEDYRRETIPHVFGTDRQAMLRHRSSRLFRDTPFWTIQPQGREEGGRRDDRVLFMGLTNPALLTPWLERLRQAKVPLVGIYSLPLLTVRLLPYLDADTEHVLVVSLQSGGSLRQTFFHRRDLKLSRLARLPLLESRELAQSTVDEVEKLRRYLHSLRLLPREGVLDVYILGYGRYLAELERQPPPVPLVRRHLRDLATVAGQIGMSAQFVSPYADSLFAQLLLKARPGNHYARGEDRRYYRLHGLRLGMLAASVAATCGGVLWGGVEVVEGMALRHRAAVARQQAEFYQDRYAQARGALPDTPVEAKDLEAAVETVATLAVRATSPLDLVGVVSRGLERYPSLKVDEVDWHVEARSPPPPPGQPVELRVPDAPKQLYHVVDLRGRISPFDGNYRWALEQVQGLAESLRDQAGVEQVELLTLPLSVSPTQSLQGEVGARPNEGKAQFALRVLFRKAEDGPA